MQLSKFEELLTYNTDLGVNISTIDVLVSLLITLAISLFIYYVYRKTYSGALYSKNFNVSLIITSLIVAMVIAAISKSLTLSLGLLGALSIIRFRTPIKDPKDVTFIFWAISVGVVNGVRLYKLSIISSIFIGITLFILHKRLTTKDNSYLINMKVSRFNEAEIAVILKKYCNKYNIRHIALSNLEKEVIIEVNLKIKTPGRLVKELNDIRGVEKIMMFSHTGELTE